MTREDIGSFRLSNGVAIPRIGFGVFRMSDPEECENAVVEAIHAGYRYIDTAAAYENEEAVGRAIQRCGVPRDELFIATKLWVTDTTYDGAKCGYERSLKRLGLDYVDLYIIHQPYNDCYGAWRALEEMYSAGRMRAIGIDNFTQDRLADFIHFNKIKPMVNFIECNAFFQREPERLYHTSQDIHTLAWSPLAAGQANLFSNPTLAEIAGKHAKSIAQVVLRWLVQRDIVPLVKSSNPKRMRENLDIFDFELRPDEMQAIAALDTGRSCFTARDNAAAVEAFLQNADRINV